MEHYVTYFDSFFLPQGLALHLSMERHVCSYTLWILCVDDEAFDVLTRLTLPNVRLLQLTRLETSELKNVKATRSRGEYCWTLTPFAPRFVFEADPKVERVTYLDADMWFRRNPTPIFREFDAAKKHVLITDHAYLADYDQSAMSGQYCVQFMTFTRNGGETIRKWWEDRCIEWCFARYEDGKFGDQKYLDDWPDRFIDKVHVLQDQQLLLAPWNVGRFPYGRAICYHFHGLRVSKSIVLNDGFAIPRSVVNHVYGRYLDDLKTATATLKSINYLPRNQIASRTLKDIVRSVFRGFYQNSWRLITRRVVKVDWW